MVLCRTGSGSGSGVGSGVGSGSGVDCDGVEGVVDGVEVVGVDGVAEVDVVGLDGCVEVEVVDVVAVDPPLFPPLFPPEDAFP